jgi:hypothetical protein
VFIAGMVENASVKVGLMHISYPSQGSGKLFAIEATRALD